MSGNGRIKSQLINLLHRAHQMEQELIDRLTDQEQEALGEPDHWAAKDELAHQAHWQERLARNIQAAMRGEELPPNVDDFNQANAQVFEQYRQCSFAEIIDLCERSHQTMLECVQGLSEEDLTSTEIMPRQDGRSLWRSVVGNSFMHAIIHLAQIYNRRGDSQTALDIQAEAADLLAGLDDSPEWKGLLPYNLACQYSLSGKKEQAVALLREGLALNPGLTDFSKQDPDFDPIRADAEYQAIYEGSD